MSEKRINPLFFRLSAIAAILVVAWGVFRLIGQRPGQGGEPPGPVPDSVRGKTLGPSVAVADITKHEIIRSETIALEHGATLQRQSIVVADRGGREKLFGVSIFDHPQHEGNPIRLEDAVSQNYASHIDQLGFKIFDRKLTEAELLQEISSPDNWVCVEDLVKSGHVEVLSENPSWILVLGLPIAVVMIGNTDLNPWNPTTPTMVHDDVPSDLEKKKAWAKFFIGGQHCEWIKASAERNNIPPRLLAAVILNEVSDYGVKDQAQEAWLPYGTTGWAQLKPNVVQAHGLIKPKNDPLRDVVNTYNFPEYIAIWKMLNQPEHAFELAAREISYILDLWDPETEIGQDRLTRPLAQVLLKKPSQGWNREDLCANLEDSISKRQLNSDEERIWKEGVLMNIISGAYNGNGALVLETDRTKIFSAIELSQIDKGRAFEFRDHIPGGEASIQHKNDKGKLVQSVLWQARVHGAAAQDLWPEFLFHHWPCLDVEEKVGLAYRTSCPKTVPLPDPYRFRHFSIYYGNRESGLCLDCKYYIKTKDEVMLSSETHMLDGVKHGRHVSYSTEGKVRHTSTFEQGRIHGVATDYGKTGSISKKTTYEHGKMKKAEYYSRGELIDTTTYD